MDPIGPHSLTALADGFAAAHRRLYGFAAEDEPVQLVTFRVEAAGVVPKATFTARAADRLGRGARVDRMPAGMVA